jgi:hypothetical protein
MHDWREFQRWNGRGMDIDETDRLVAARQMAASRLAIHAPAE